MPMGILARVALELKYSVDPTTKDKISTIYSNVTGKPPTKRMNLLNWFLTNFEFDGTDTWYYKDRNLPN